MKYECKLFAIKNFFSILFASTLSRYRPPISLSNDIGIARKADTRKDQPTIVRSSKNIWNYNGIYFVSRQIQPVIVQVNFRWNNLFS
jgi:hypothetical protein